MRRTQCRYAERMFSWIRQYFGLLLCCVVVVERVDIDIITCEWNTKPAIVSCYDGKNFSLPNTDDRHRVSLCAHVKFLREKNIQGKKDAICSPNVLVHETHPCLLKDSVWQMRSSPWATIKIDIWVKSFVRLSIVSFTFHNTLQLIVMINWKNLKTSYQRSQHNHDERAPEDLNGFHSLPPQHPTIPPINRDIQSIENETKKKLSKKGNEKCFRRVSEASKIYMKKTQLNFLV